MYYIKKTISSKSELKFIKLDLIESKGIIDKIILIDSNFTHSGLKRNYIEDDVKNFFSVEESERIIYLKIDIALLVKKNTIKPYELHFNERVIRGFFEYELNLNKDDIIFSLDADEVLYRKTYAEIINLIEKNNKAYLIKLWNLMYRPDYLCRNLDFIAPTACKVNYYNKLSVKIKSKFKKYKQWRYHGDLYSKTGGVHFNWHLTPKEMVIKINNYSHRDLFYESNKDEKYFEKCIKDKKYVGSNKNILIEQLKFGEENILPKSFYPLKHYFEYLIY